MQTRCGNVAYLWGTGGHEEGVGPAGVVVVVHGRRHVQSHELQGRDEARQAAVALLHHGVRVRHEEAQTAGAHAAVCV